MLGKIIGGHYKIIYFLGGGAFGRVYLALNKSYNKDFWCVIKQLHPDISPLNSINWETAKRLFDSEASALQILGEHDKIPKLFDYFEEDNEFYLIEEFIDGHELHEELMNSKFNEKQVYELLIDILETLRFIQEKNIIHRDITPDNLIRRRVDTKLVFIDFGAVKQVLINPEGHKRRSKTIGIGKETYMPDEQANGRPGFYSDIYAVGVIGIQACIGCLPFQGDNGEFIWRDQASVSSTLADILDKMTRCFFKERYQSASEVLQDLYDLDYTVIEISQFPYNFFSFNYTDTWYKRANFLKNRKHHESAILLYKKVIEINPRHYKAKFNMGIAFSYIHLDREAIDSYKQALAIKPQSFEAWFHKGISFYKLSSYEEALEAFNNTIQIRACYAAAWLYKGRTLRQLGNEQEAMNSFHEAIRLRSSFAAIVMYSN